MLSYLHQKATLALRQLLPAAIADTSTNNTTTTTHPPSSTSSSPSNALVPLLQSANSKDSGSSSSSLNASSPHPTAVFPSAFPFAGYALNKGFRPTLRAPSVLPGSLQPAAPAHYGMSPYATFAAQPPHPAAAAAQPLSLGYHNVPGVSVAGMMPYQTSSMMGMATAGATHGMAHGSYPAVVTAGTAAMAASPSAAQFVYSQMPYHMSNLMVPQAASAPISGVSQYNTWAAAAAAQAAAAAASGTVEQPYKKLKTV